MATKEDKAFWLKVQNQCKVENEGTFSTRLTNYIRTFNSAKLESFLVNLDKAIPIYISYIQKREVATIFPNVYLCIFVEYGDFPSRFSSFIRRCVSVHMNSTKAKKQFEYAGYLTMSIYCLHGTKNRDFLITDNLDYIKWVNFNRLMLLKLIRSLIKEELSSRLAS